MTLPAISELFKTSLDESLKKFLQPAGLGPAAILVLLNLVAIYPPLSDRKFGPVAAFDGLDDLWKVVVATLIVVALGFLIVSFSGSILRLFTGELWRDTRLFEKLRDGKVAAIEAFETEINGLAEGSADRNQKQYQRDTEFPDPAQVMPTRLGNVMNATATGVFKAYGIDLAALWAQMRDVMRGDETQAKALAEIDEQKANLDTLVNLAFVFPLFALEGLLLGLPQGETSFFAWAVVSLALGFVAYNAAVATALGWGDQVQAAFDLYRGSLLTAFGIPTLKKVSDQKARWTALSTAVGWNSLSDDIFEPDTSATTQPVAKSTSSVSFVDTSPTAAIASNGSTVAPLALRRRWIFPYRFLVSAIKGESDVIGLNNRSYLEISDDRLPDVDLAPVTLSIASPPGVIAQVPAAVPRPAGSPPPPLTFSFSGLGRGQSAVLAFEIGFELVLACVVSGPNPNAADIELVRGGDGAKPPPLDYEFSIRTFSGNDLTLRLTFHDTRRQPTDVINVKWGIPGTLNVMPPPARVGADYIFDVVAALPGTDYRLLLEAEIG